MGKIKMKDISLPLRSLGFSLLVYLMARYEWLTFYVAFLTSIRIMLHGYNYYEKEKVPRSTNTTSLIVGLTTWFIPRHGIVPITLTIVVSGIMLFAMGYLHEDNHPLSHSDNVETWSFAVKAVGAAISANGILQVLTQLHMKTWPDFF